MTRLLIVLAALPLLILGALAAVLLLGVQDAPLVTRTARIGPEHIERARTLWDRHDPRRLRPGAVRTVSIGQEDLDVALLYLANRYASGSSRVVLHRGEAVVAATFELPANPVGRFLNLDAVLVESAGLPRVAALRIGRLPVPAWLGNRLLDGAVERVRGRPDLRAVLESVRQVRASEGHVDVTFQWQPEMMAHVRHAAVAPADRERLAAYHARLVEVSRDPTLPSSVSLSVLVPPLFTLAAERSRDGDPAAENRAAILMLALYALGQPPEAVVPDSAGWPRAADRAVTLGGRDDFAKHFLVSAALAAYAGEPLADAIGVYKEVADARGGSGFSFNDIAADRAGSRFGERAVARGTPARRLQAFASGPLRDRDLIPPTDDLPEFLPEAEFQRRFGGIGAPAYQAMLADIERRVAELPFNR